MKIAIFTTYYSPEKNGLVNYIAGLYTSLKKQNKNIEVDIITFDTKNLCLFYEKDELFNIYRLPCYTILNGTYALPKISNIFLINKIFKKNKYDIINTHTRFFVTSLIGLIFSKVYKVKLVHTEHGSGFVEHENILIRILAILYDLSIGKFVIKKADLITAVSKPAAIFSEKLGSKKVVIINNGIDLFFWKNNKMINKEIDELNKEGEKIFVFIGRLIKTKGCQDLIKVVAEINKIEKWKLLVIGDGYFKKSLENLATRLHLEKKIRFLGNKNKDYIRDILSIADLYINPSYAKEGLPTTLLEATACNCKVITSSAGGVDSIFSPDNIYKVGNNIELKEKIENFETLKIPNIRSYNWDQIAKRYYSEIESL